MCSLSLLLLGNGNVKAVVKKLIDRDVEEHLDLKKLGYLGVGLAAFPLVNCLSGHAYCTCKVILSETSHLSENNEFFLECHGKSSLPYKRLHIYFIFYSLFGLSKNYSSTGALSCTGSAAGATASASTASVSASISSFFSRRATLLIVQPSSRRIRITPPAVLE